MHLLTILERIFWHILWQIFRHTLQQIFLHRHTHSIHSGIFRQRSWHQPWQFWHAFRHWVWQGLEMAQAAFLLAIWPSLGWHRSVGLLCDDVRNNRSWKRASDKAGILAMKKGMEIMQEELESGEEWSGLKQTSGRRCWHKIQGHHRHLTLLTGGKNRFRYCSDNRAKKKQMDDMARKTEIQRRQ